MKAGFEPGIVREVAVEVTEDMCPAFDGVIVHRVYSTWSMVHHMEVAARKVLIEFLEADEEGIGTRVAVDHKAPAVLGQRVTVRAELVEVRDRLVICRVTAWDGDRLLGEGEQHQKVLKKDRLKRVFERSQARG